MGWGGPLGWDMDWGYGLGGLEGDIIEIRGWNEEVK